MSNQPKAYFHHELLAADFQQCAARALRDATIDAQEHSWLEAALTGTLTTGSARIDLLGVDDGSDPPALTGALMISNPGVAAWPVFLQSPLFGLEVFEDRTALDDALRHRITRHDTTLEATQVQGGAFVAQMDSYLGMRARRLERMAEELALLPDLDTQAADSTTTAGSAVAYQRALNQFWKTPTPGSKHLHQLASKAFAEGFYQDLAGARLAANDKALLRLDPQWPPLQAPALDCEKVQVRLGNQWVDLAGAFTFSMDAQPGVMLYWPESGLHSLAGRGALNTFLDALAPPLSLPLQYADQWRKTASRRYQSQPIKQSVFVERVDSIVALQQLNLAHALALASDDISAAQVVVDDALDIRGLLDRRLRGLDPRLRWARIFSDATLDPPPVDLTLKPLLQGIDRLVWLANERDVVYRATPGVRAVAQRLLNPALAVFDAGLEADTILLGQAATVSGGEAPRRYITLAQVLFDRISGFRTAPITADDWVCGADHQHLPFFPPSTLEALLNRTQLAFAGRFTELLGGMATLNLCLDNHWASVPGILRRNLEDGIRLEMSLHVYYLTTPPALLNRLKQIFDHPLARQRQALGTQMARAFGLQLNHLPGTPPVRLELTLVIDQPGSPDQAVLFWSPVEGLKAYASLEQLSRELIINLTTGRSHDKWLTLLPAGQQGTWTALFKPGLSAFLHISTWAIADDVIDTMQSRTELHQRSLAQTALQFVKAGHYPAGISEPFLEIPRKLDPIADYFEAQSWRFADLHTREALPDWLNLAPLQDQATFASLLQRSLDSLKPENSYLFGIPAIHTFARTHLQARLAKDFAALQIDPDKVSITLKSFTPALVPAGEIPSGVPAATVITEHTLTQVAINHFSDNLGAVMTIHLADGLALPALLTPDYVRRVVRELDLGGKYQALLATELSHDNEHFPLRQERFSATVSAMLMQATFQHVLQDYWSRDALHYVSAVLDMPDGVARQPENGRSILFSRMQLRAADDLAPDTVSGAYLIGPADPAMGPVIMFSTYAPHNSLRIYSSRTELEESLHKDALLQAQILARLGTEARRTYDNGGFVEPHLRWNTESSFDIVPQTPAPATLHVEPITANALDILMQDNTAYVQAIAKTQAVTTAQAQWGNFINLMSLGVEQASLFLPGRLAALANLWQAKTWAGAATDAIRSQQWGKALSEFAAALATLAGAKAADEPIATGPAAVGPPPSNRLRSYEARNVSLVNLSKDLGLPVYRNGPLAYAAVEGKVYRVFQQGEQWHIFTDPLKPGPRIRLNSERHWVLDQPGGLLGGGIGSSRIDEFESLVAELDDEVKSRFTTTASGMTQIRAADRLKARHIAAAHSQALRYLRVCLRNLDADRQLGFIPHTSDVILQGVFGFPATPTTLTQRLRNIISDIYTDMLSPSMSPKTSARFVIGSHKRSDDASDAFTYPEDPARRVFLTEGFFTYLFPADTTLSAQANGFDARTHFQATVLIHELSHLNHKTADIAYLAAAAPYPDMISEPFAQVRQDLLETQNRGLSVNTPRGKLFKFNDNGVLRDLRSSDGRALSTILKITGARSLEQARDVFYRDPVKRCDVMLANADTIALLITKLGRVPFHTTSV